MLGCNHTQRSKLHCGADSGLSWLQLLRTLLERRDGEIRVTASPYRTTLYNMSETVVRRGLLQVSETQTRRSWDGLCRSIDPPGTTPGRFLAVLWQSH